MRYQIPSTTLIHKTSLKTNLEINKYGNTRSMLRKCDEFNLMKF